jgi:thioredoxin-related protein
MTGKHEKGWTRTVTVHGLVVAVVALGLWGGSVAAQGVQWRHDYSTARREAAETGRPLVIDFGTRDCFWCRKLDTTTFRDPAVGEVMNTRFIPLKVDAEREAALADALGVEGYPTIVLADADGRILDALSGYLDAAHFVHHLQAALAAGRAQPRSADVMQPAADDRLGALYLTLAEAWLEEGDQKQAVLCLERVVQASPGTAQAQIAQARLAQILAQQTP